MLALPRRLASVFNFTGSEIAFLVLIGLIVLGPEKLPDAVRRFTKAYNEFKKMATGFQGEMKQAFDEPMRELRGTADAVRKAADFDLSLEGKGLEGKSPEGKKGDVSATTGKPSGSLRRDGGLNFGTPAAKRRDEAAASIDEVTKVQDAEE
jgi:Tat protein translocase TatB subunit